MNGYDDFVNNCELSDFENITLSTDPNNPTVMPYDGFITFDCIKGEGDNSGEYKLVINGKALTYMFASDSPRYGYFLQLAIKKGDTIYFSLDRYIRNTLVRYYKKRDYSNR